VAVQHPSDTVVSVPAPWASSEFLKVFHRVAGPATSRLTILAAHALTGRTLDNRLAPGGPGEGTGSPNAALLGYLLRHLGARFYGLCAQLVESGS
jgi:hypothetical protein